MKLYQHYTLFVFTCLTFLFFGNSKSTAQTRLTVSPEMVTNLSASGEAWLLFDYQNLNGNYPCEIPQADFPWVYFNATSGGKTFYYPVDVVLDLGYSQTLTQICLRDATNPGGMVTVSAGGTDPSSWSTLYQHLHDSAECRTLSSTTRYLRFRFNSTDARIREIELYGTQSNNIICPPPITACSPIDDCNCVRPTMDKFIGVNANLDIPPAKINPFGTIRNYQTSYFSIGYDDPSYPSYPDGRYAFAPTVRTEFDVDYFYQHMQDIGVDVTSTSHHAPSNLVTFGYLNNDFNYNALYPFSEGTIDNPKYHSLVDRKPFSEALYPISLGAKYEDPAMYLEYSEWFYQLAARYGSPGNTENLKVVSGNTARSGLNSIQFIENWNEPDKNWHYFLINDLNFLDPYVEEELGYFSPFEYAAMSSANYDGNGQTNGTENILLDRFSNNIPSNASPVGIKAANSNIKFVMAGLKDINIEYVKALKFWFDHYRPDIDFPFDVINFHDYANDATPGNTLGQHGISPEAYGLKEKMEEAVTFRDRYLPGVELWLSEFGYDSNPYSVQSADCSLYCSDCSSPACMERFQEIQAQWILRSYLEIAAAGVDRAMVFTLRDNQHVSSGALYQTSGVCTYEDDGFVPKTSWYYISAMSKALAGMKYDPSFTHNDSNVRVYKFVEDCGGSGKTVYAVWSPTAIHGNDTPVLSNYPLPFVGNNAAMIQLANEDIDGNRTILTPQCNGQICVDVSETPKFIIVNDNDPAPDFSACNCNYIDYEISGTGTAGRLNNEQNNLGELYCGEGNTMSSPWTTFAGQEVVINLNSLHDLNSLYFHCNGAADADVQIYFGSSGNWQLYKIWNTLNPSPSKWRSFYFDENITTQYIRIRAMSSNIVIDEMAVCGVLSNPVQATCFDNIQNGNETGVDCGGNCTPCVVATCNDGIQNGNETGVDCGGNCPSCATCFDNIQNGNETGVDCGGSCTPCTVATCNDGIQNGNETGIDCGGNCPPCNTGSCQISLTPSMFFDIYGQAASGAGFAGSLANEQNTMGDPINGNGIVATDAWQFPWADGMQAYVDLGQEYDISSIHLYDGYGSGKFQVSPGLPNQNLAPIIDVTLNLWPPDWRAFNNMATTTRYLTFTRVDGEAKVNEISICGTVAGTGPSCNDGIQNGNETGVDCGESCPPCTVASCNDGIQNGNETGVDCGGNCPPCATCFDNIQNGNETGVDCGGSCPACTVATCNDGIQNGNETGVDCGGICPPCNTGSCLIPLQPSMFYNIYNQSDAASNFSGSLADEQNLMNDPINGNGNEMFTPWQYPWFDGVQGYLDLGQEYLISGIYLYDGYGSGRFRVSAGLPDDNNPAIVEEELNAWPPDWRSFEGLNVATRYLTFTRLDGEAKVNEIALCGYPTGSRNVQERPAPILEDVCKTTIYPNPVNDVLYIRSGMDVIKRLVVTDVNGKVLIERTNLDAAEIINFDVSSLQRGIYMLYVEDEGNCGPKVERFVKLDEF